MSVSSPEAANGIGFTLIFPITFISSAFVPVESMPAGLEQVAEVNPVSVVVDAMRALWLGRARRQQLLAVGRLVLRADRGVRAARGPALPPALAARLSRVLLARRGRCTVLRLTLSRTDTTPSVTRVSVPAHVSCVSQRVPRTVAAL